MRRDEWNKNDFFREQSGSAKPFFEVNIGGYSIGGPVVIPKLIDSRTSQKKVYFFLSQEWTEDIRPTDVFRTEHADGARAAGRLLADVLRQGHAERGRLGHRRARHLQIIPTR